MKNDILTTELLDAVEKRLTQAESDHYKATYSKEHRARESLKRYIHDLKTDPKAVEPDDREILRRLYDLDPGKGGAAAVTALGAIFFGTWWGHMHGGYRIPTAICPILALSFVGMVTARWRGRLRGLAKWTFPLTAVSGVVGLLLSYPLWKNTLDFLSQHDVSHLESGFSFFTAAVAGAFAITPLFSRSGLINILFSIPAAAASILLFIGIIHWDISTTTAAIVQTASGAVFGAMMALNMTFIDRATIKDPTSIYTKIYRKYRKRIDKIGGSETHTE